MTELIIKNSKKLFISILLIVAISGFILFKKDNSEAQENTVSQDKKIVAVGVKKVGESKIVNGKMKHPGTIVGDQEVKITAGAGGTAIAVNFNLGDQIGQGKILVKIDDQGSAFGESGFQSGQIQQLENAVEQADEAYDRAKDAYEDDKNDTTKSAKDIAKLQKENAQIALQSAVESRLIKAPISGTITSKNVSIGDSITPGQLLATISKTNKMKVQFYLDREEIKNVKVESVVIIDNFGENIEAKVINVSSQADPVSKRFLVEAVPQVNNDLFIGSIISVMVNTYQSADENNSLILPLSALTIAQNENYIFVVEDGKAKKVRVKVVKITGETAEISADLANDSLVIVEGNKLVQDGELVEIE